MRTQAGIIGGGPAGLLLSQILHRNGVENVVLERRSRGCVLGRIRAGVLEWGSVEVLRNAGVGERLDREGWIHDGSRIAWAGRRHQSRLRVLNGKDGMRKPLGLAPAAGPEDVHLLRPRFLDTFIRTRRRAIGGRRRPALASCTNRRSAGLPAVAVCLDAAP